MWRSAVVAAGCLLLGACSWSGGNKSGLGSARADGPGSARDFHVSIGDEVFFIADSAQLSTESRETLVLQADWLERYTTFPVIVEGYADEPGSREHNLALGYRRAEVVKAFLIAKGVPAQRIRIVSYGSDRPVASCKGADCRFANRRTRTVLAGA